MSEFHVRIVKRSSSEDALKSSTRGRTANECPATPRLTQKSSWCNVGPVQQTLLQRLGVAADCHYRSVVALRG